MSPQYVLALGLTATAGILFAIQRRLLNHRPPDPHHTPAGPVTVTCGDCGQTYFCVPHGVRAAVQLHYSYKCSMSGYDHWRDAG